MKKPRSDAAKSFEAALTQALRLGRDELANVERERGGPNRGVGQVVVDEATGAEMIVSDVAPHPLAAWLDGLERAGNSLLALLDQTSPALAVNYAELLIELLFYSQSVATFTEPNDPALVKARAQKLVSTTASLTSDRGQARAVARLIIKRTERLRWGTPRSWDKLLTRKVNDRLKELGLASLSLRTVQRYREEMFGPRRRSTR